MGAAVFGLESLLDPYLIGPMAMRYAALVVLVGTGCAIYGLACFVTGAFRVADVKALIRRRSTN